MAPTYEVNQQRFDPQQIKTAEGRAKLFRCQRQQLQNPDRLTARSADLWGNQPEVVKGVQAEQSSRWNSVEQQKSSLGSSQVDCKNLENTPKRASRPSAECALPGTIIIGV